MSLHIAILYGSVREVRAGIRVVRFLTGALRRRGHTTTVFDAAEQCLPLLDRMYKEYGRGTAPPVLEELAQLYRCLLYTSPSPRDGLLSRMPSSA